MNRTLASGCLLALTLTTALAARSLSGAAWLDSTPSVVSANPEAPATLSLLYDQSTMVGNSIVISQDFQAALDDYDAEAADDFTVPAGRSWRVSRVFAAGLYSQGALPTAAVNVSFYATAGQIPGSAVCSYPSVPVAPDQSGNLTVDLPTPCSLQGGTTYWVSVQPRLDYGPEHSVWFWINRAPLTGEYAAWRNPGGFHGQGCTVWGRRSLCWPDPENDADELFRLYGQVAASTFDFDADGKTDRTVFRPSNSVWYTALSGGGATATGWGAAGDVDVAGDFDGDAKADVAVWRPSTGTWFIVQSGNGTTRAAVWGANGDVPLAGDVDGDRKDDLVIFRPSAGAWFVLKSGGGTTTLGWGISTDQPLLGDFNGDGKSDAVAYRPSSGVWYIAYSGGGSAAVGWGTASDIPVIGDWDGDGKADQAIFRPASGQWFVNKSTGGTIVVGWGQSGDVPVSGDMDGDGKSDYNIFRNGIWFSQLSGGGSAAVGWGIAGDKPVGRLPGS